MGDELIVTWDDGVSILFYLSGNGLPLNSLAAVEIGIDLSVKLTGIREREVE